MRDDARCAQLEAEIARLDTRLAHLDSKLALFDLFDPPTDMPTLFDDVHETQARAAETRAEARRLRENAITILAARRSRGEL